MIFPLFWGLFSVLLLVAAGWPLANLLKCSVPWAAAWIMGVIGLFVILLFCQLMGWGLTFPHACIGLALLFFLPLISMWKRQPNFTGLQMPEWILTPSWTLALVACSVALLATRAFLQPLSGADTLFRWDLLARQTLELGHINFYPPRSAEDYTVYFYPDGIAPLVSWVYWWVYSVCGKHLPETTYAVQVMTYLSVLGLAYHFIQRVADRTAALAGLLMLTGSPLLFWVFLQGQETGFTTLGVIGMLYFLTESKTNTLASVVAAAGTALVILAREYGWAFFIAGLAAAALMRLSPRLILAYGILTLSLSLPWYLRNWWLTGNPFNSLDVFGLFPVNPVHVGIMRSYNETNGWKTLGISGWFQAGTFLLQMAPLPLLLGFCAAWTSLPKMPWLWLSAALTLLIWISSLGYVSSGIFYSYRTLGPALVLLVLASSWWLFSSGLLDTTGKQQVILAVLLLFGCYGLLNSLTSPLMAKSVSVNKWASSAFTPRPLFQVSALQYPGSESTEKVLTDNAYLHALAVEGGQGKRYVPVWSSETLFLFDKKDVQLQKISLLGITRATAGLGFEPPNDRFFSRFAFFKEILPALPVDRNGLSVLELNSSP